MMLGKSHCNNFGHRVLINAQYLCEYLLNDVYYQVVMW